MLHNIGIIGHGFVGLAAETGFQKIANVRVHDKYKESESLESVVNNSDIIFLCLPTPMHSTGACDIGVIEGVCAEIDQVALGTKILVVKSTVPPGTTQKLSQRFSKHTWAFNPEFLTEKSFIDDFIRQDRIIVGIPSTVHRNEDVLRLVEFYLDFIDWQNKTYPEEKFAEGVTLCHTQQAEMAKYFANAFLAMKVTFANEMSEICKAAGIDYAAVAGLAAKDKRIGPSHLQVPGPDGLLGYGGKCFPKDLSALLAFARDLDLDPMILDTVWTKNLLIREEYDWEEIPGVCIGYNKR